MPLNDDLKNVISTSLSSLVPLELTSKSVNDLYELFVFSIMIEGALEQPGCVVDYFDRRVKTTSINLTKGPRALGRGNYTRAIITIPGSAELEAHIGVYVLGRSGMKHECDILVLPQTEADRCRYRTKPYGKAEHPLCRKVSLYCECKCYEATNFTINHGRAFLGLVTDVYVKGICATMVTTKESKHIKKLLDR